MVLGIQKGGNPNGDQMYNRWKAIGTLRVLTKLGSIMCAIDREMRSVSLGGTWKLGDTGEKKQRECVEIAVVGVALLTLCFPVCYNSRSHHARTHALSHPRTAPSSCSPSLSHTRHPHTQKTHTRRPRAHRGGRSHVHALDVSLFPFSYFLLAAGERAEQPVDGHA